MEIQEIIEGIRREGSLFFWRGNPEDYKQVVEYLWNHWLSCGYLAEEDCDGDICNMHSDPACVDRKHLTKRPATWINPKDRAPVCANRRG